MPEDKKPDNNNQAIIETFRAIKGAKDMDSLIEALDHVKTYNKDEQVELINAIELYTLNEINHRTPSDLEEQAVFDALAEFATTMLGGKDAVEEFAGIMDDSDNFEIHSVLLRADAVAEAKDDKTNPKLLDYLDATSLLSDDDYNNNAKLSEAFFGVAKKHLLAEQKDKKQSNNKSNPLRGKYGKGNGSKP